MQDVTQDRITSHRHTVNWYDARHRATSAAAPPRAMWKRDALLMR